MSCRRTLDANECRVVDDLETDTVDTAVVAVAEGPYRDPIHKRVHGLRCGQRDVAGDRIDRTERCCGVPGDVHVEPGGSDVNATADVRRASIILGRYKEACNCKRSYDRR